MNVRTLATVAAAVTLTIPIGAGTAGAAESQAHDRNSICTGTLTAPGLLAGTYRGDVVVRGACIVNGGPAVVMGDLTLAPGSALDATFARNDVAGTGISSLAVRDDVNVGRGATLLMGCEPNFSPCSDDPASATGGTLTGQNRVGGNLEASGALAAIVHASRFAGDVTQTGGGGGLSCAPPTTGVFSLMHSPVFSDYEDNSVGGDLKVAAVQSCYLGVLRNHVRDLVAANDTMGDSDANEVLSNVVAGDIACAHNSPAIQYGDSMGTPNRVEHQAFGECAFNVTQPNPSPSGPPAPISVHT